MLLRCVLCNNGSYPHAVCLFSESYVLHLFQTDASFLPRTLATNPTRSAAMIVPSRTPLRCPVNTKDRTAAITAMETSKQIFVVPKLVLHVRTIARTKDSPGNITTSASTSMYTPNPRIPNQKIYDFHNVCLWIYPCKQKHGQIDEISKDNGYRYLQNMFQFKIFTQDQQLQ